MIRIGRMRAIQFGSVWLVFHGSRFEHVELIVEGQGDAAARRRLADKIVELIPAGTLYSAADVL